MLGRMQRTDIEHLASLARIKLTAEEAAQLEGELSSIMSYVGTVGAILGNDATAEPTVGPVHNVFRADEVTNQPDQYTEDILAEMPETHGRYLAVKKILNNDE